MICNLLVYLLDISRVEKIYTHRQKHTLFYIYIDEYGISTFLFGKKNVNKKEKV